MIDENKTYREPRNLEFNGQKPYKFKFAGQVLILIQEEDEKVMVYNTKTKDFRKANFDKYCPKEH